MSASTYAFGIIIIKYVFYRTHGNLFLMKTLIRHDSSSWHPGGDSAVELTTPVLLIGWASLPLWGTWGNISWQQHWRNSEGMTWKLFCPPTAVETYSAVSFLIYYCSVIFVLTFSFPSQTGPAPSHLYIVKCIADNLPPWEVARPYHKFREMHHILESVGVDMSAAPMPRWHANA